MLHLSFNTPLLSETLVTSSSFDSSHMRESSSVTALLSNNHSSLLFPGTSNHFVDTKGNEYHTPNKKNEVQSIDNDFDFSSCLWSYKRLPVTHSLFQPDEIFISHHPPRTSGWQGIKIHHHPFIGLQLSPKYYTLTLNSSCSVCITDMNDTSNPTAW